jgi:hypothetical protein
MRLAAIIGIIVISLLVIAVVWYNIQQLLRNDSARVQDDLMARGCTPVDYDAQGSPIAWSCPSE